MKKILEKLKTLGIPVIILLLVILGVIFILSNSNTQLNNSNTEDNAALEESEDSINVLEVTDKESTVIAGKKITFNENFFINTTAQANRVSGISCGSAGNETCIINFITNGVDTYYISTPLEPVASDGLIRDLDTVESISIKDNTIFLKYAKIFYVNDEGSSIKDKYTVSQIYGCIESGICVGSGFLDNSSDQANAESVIRFEQFLKSISIQ